MQSIEERFAQAAHDHDKKINAAKAAALQKLRTAAKESAAAHRQETQARALDPTRSRQTGDEREEKPEAGSGTPSERKGEQPSAGKRGRTSSGRAKKAPGRKKRGKATGSISSPVSRETRTCPLCGKEFEITHGRQKYCCAACRNNAARYRYKGITPITKTCVICGKPFRATPKSPRVTCGDPACVRTRLEQRQYHPVQHDPIPCVVCGKPFSPHHCKTVVCDACKKAMDEAHWHTCPVCGKEFFSDLYHHVYCSPECRSAAQRYNKKKRS